MFDYDVIVNMYKILPILFFLLLTTPTKAEVFINEQDTYYSVPGSTKGQIIRNMERYAPFHKEKFYVPAFALPQISYNYSWVVNGGYCDVSEVEVHLNITYTYPQLEESPSSYVQEWWDELVERYVIHEEIHGDIAIQAAEKLEGKLLSVQEVNCDDIQEVVEQKVNYYVRQMNKKQDEYDRITNHGMDQQDFRGL